MGFRVQIFNVGNTGCGVPFVSGFEFPPSVGRAESGVCGEPVPAARPV